MSIFRGMNFGPELGPIASGVERAMQGRWVGIRKYDTADANPLQGGHWGTEWHWYDPPDGGGDQYPIGTGIDGGGGSSGGYRRKWFPPPPPPDDCPKWARPIPGPTGTQESCTEAQKAKLRAAYKHLTTDTGWAKALDPIADENGVPLMTCLSRVWCDLAANCAVEREVPVAGADRNWYKNLYHARNNIIGDIPNPRIVMNPDLINDVDTWEIAHNLLLRLVLACGGTLLDAFALSEIHVKSDPDRFRPVSVASRNQEFIEALLEELELSSNSSEVVYDRRLRTTRFLVKGKYVWWDRENGDVGITPRLDTDALLNFDWNLTDITKKRWRF